MKTSSVIIKNLLNDEEYIKRVLPFLQVEYFESKAEQKLFEHIKDYITRYNESPTVEALYIELTNDRSINEQVFESIQSEISVVKAINDKPSLKWLIDTTEEFCKRRALFNALHDSIQIESGTDPKHRSVGIIPEILTKALSVSFDTSVGHDFLEDYKQRFDYYHRKEEKIATGLTYIDKVTKGGFSNKTLNMLLAGTHGGKTAMMCHFAANNLLEGKNVLYVTLEMSEEEISKRVDANLLNVSFDDLMELPEIMYADKLNRLKQKTTGKLIVKQYPTASAHVGHIRTLLNELYLKKGFQPDVIYLDYIGIMASFRIKQGANVNSYTYVKVISEEVRGLAVEMDLPIVSGAQLNRGGFSSSDPDMDDVAESFGLAFTADWMVALLSNEELIKENLMLICQLKSRYDDKNRIPKFFVGFDRMKMKFYDVDDAFDGLHRENSDEVEKIVKPDKKKFGGFKT